MSVDTKKNEFRSFNKKSFRHTKLGYTKIEFNKGMYTSKKPNNIVGFGK